MRNLTRLTIFTAIAAAAGCSGTIDPENQDNLPVQEPFTLSVDKDSIESDGKDAATFVITDANGNVLTDAEHIGNTSFHIAETDEWMSGLITRQPNVLTSITDGTYHIDAMYDGKRCANTVSVTSSNRSRYEKFHKNVALFRLTATWCGYCPSMTEVLGKLSGFNKDHCVLLSFHNADEFSIPYNSSTDFAGALLSRFGGNDDGLPYCIYSLSEGSGSRKLTDIQTIIKRQLYETPATTGIAATSAIKGNEMTVSIQVEASAAGKYDLGMAIVKNNCAPSSPSANEQEYDNIVIGITGNCFVMSGETSFSLDAGEKKELEHSWKSDLLSTDAVKDCDVVLFTLKKMGEKTIIDNSVRFKAGESCSFRYN